MLKPQRRRTLRRSEPLRSQPWQLRIEPLEDRHLMVCAVTSLADPTAQGETTLRDCIGSGDDMIMFAVGGSGQQTIHLEDGPLVVDNPITIIGMLNHPTETSSGIVISGEPTGVSEGSRIFEIGTKGELTLNEITLSFGNGTGNLADGFGGAIYNRGRLVISDSTLNANRAAVGGAIYSETSDVQLFQSTISGNTADSSGGGIYIKSRTVAAPVRFDRNTITLNFAGETGGGIYLGPEVEADIRNSIVSGNLASDRSDVRNTAGALVDFKLFGSTDFSFFYQYGPPLQGAPRLGPLADNGGETFTHLPAINSPAIDAAARNVFDGRDQRGGRRVVCLTDGCEGTPVGMDIGSVERGSSIPAPPDCDFNNDGACDCTDIDIHGFVDGDDFLIWNANKFSSSSVLAAESFSVPVPSPSGNKRSDAARMGIVDDSMRGSVPGIDSLANATLLNGRLESLFQGIPGQTAPAIWGADPFATSQARTKHSREFQPGTPTETAHLAALDFVFAAIKPGR